MNLDDLRDLIERVFGGDDTDNVISDLRPDQLSFFAMSETEQRQRAREMMAKAAQCYRDLERSHPEALMLLDIMCMRDAHPQRLSDWINQREGAELRRKLRYASFYIRHHTKTAGDDDGGIHAAQ